MGHLLILGGLISVLTMIMVPVSPVLLDLFQSLNLAGALVLLLVSLYVPDTMRLAAFPTILLVSTLFRLALEIASCRLILTRGGAGRIIEAFGSLAAGGDLVSGIVIFLIVAFVQFLVIAKGAERVAEVAARFNLDALPGRQMSIDADLRAGLTSPEEARSARERLQQESRLYGAMDGAMKFVKGDVIAGLLITAINMVGGLILGIFFQDLPPLQALRQYSLLTIGSGLVAQIPSLLISLAAGIVLTRISTLENVHLGQEIIFQIFKESRALGAASLILLLLVFIPGFPSLTLLGLAAALGGLAYWRRRLHINEARVVPPPAAFFSATVSASIQLTLEIPPLLRQEMGEPVWGHLTNRMIPELVQRLANDIGIGLPYPQIVENPQVRVASPRGLRIRIQEITVARCELPNTASVEEKRRLLLLSLARALQRHAPRFLTIQEVKNRLKTLEQTCPDLVQEVIPRLIQIQKLTEVLQRLAQEAIPIKDLQRILHEVALMHPEDKAPAVLCEEIRGRFKDVITERFADARGRIPVFLLDPSLEDQIQGAIPPDNQATDTLMTPQETERISTAIVEKVLRPNRTGVRGPILTRPEIRGFVSRMIASGETMIPVLSYRELEAGAVIWPLGRITLSCPTTGVRPTGERVTINQEAV